VSGCGKETNTTELDREALTYVAKNEDKTPIDESDTGEKPAILQDEKEVLLPWLREYVSQLPQPYFQMYFKVQEAISKGNVEEADRISQECITLAETRGEHPELIFTLHLVLGETLMEEKMYDSAKRHVIEVAKHGGQHVFLLALCVAKSGDVDSGLSILLDEIERLSSTPGMDDMLPFVPLVLVLVKPLSPSEIVLEKIENLMNHLETEEPVSLSAVLALTDYWVFVRETPERSIALLEEVLKRDNLDALWDSRFRSDLKRLYSQRK